MAQDLSQSFPGAEQAFNELRRNAMILERYSSKLLLSVYETS